MGKKDKYIDRVLERQGEQDGASGDETRISTYFSDSFRRLRKNGLAMVCLIFIVLLVLVAIFAPLVAPHDPYEVDLKNRHSAMTPQNPLGTDEYGRDILSRIIYGTRVSLSVGVVATTITTLIGVVMGSIAGYFGGKVDTVISRIIEIFRGFPDLLFAMGVMYALGSTGIINLFIALGILGWTGTARLVRAQVLQLKEREFVEAARSAGAPGLWIIIKHLIPNCLSTIIITVSMGIPGAILSEASLSFLGLGVSQPTASWGSMISYAKTFIRRQPTYSIFPGIAIMLTVLAFNIFGDGLRDALDPRLKN